VMVSLRRGDPALLLAGFRKGSPDRNLADLGDDASRKLRKGLQPR